jgi:choline monooxygenase
MSIPTSVAPTPCPAGSTRIRPVFEACRERVFRPSWQLVTDTDRMRAPGQTLPFTLLEGMLDEPLLLTRDRDDRLHALSNVCTHRGHLVADHEGIEHSLRCRYHGRRFGLDGCFMSMPEFEGALDFPSPADSLPRVAMETFEKLVFVSLDPAISFAGLTAPVRARCAGMPWDRAVYDAARSARVHGARQLGALRRELPRGLPHSLRARGSRRGDRLR